MAEVKKGTEHTGIENVGDVLSKAEQFIEKNQKPITIAVLAIFIIVGGFFAYKKLYLAPLEEEAHSQMFVAEQYFERDSFNLALNGDGNNWGFLKIIDEYGLTKAAELSHYYAGICCLHTGKYQDAIDHLKKFDAGDKMVSPLAIGAIGDAYVELGKNDRGIEYYLKAAKKGENDLISPIFLMKAGGVCESIGNYKQALDIYQEIKDKYPSSDEGKQIIKYITRAQIKLENKK